MNMPYTRREKIAGLFLLGGLALIFISAIIVGGAREWFRSYNSYYALYNDGYGLSPGTKVKFLRTDVGMVTRLELTPNNKVKVHLSILTEYGDRIKTDSVAEIASPTFIGSEYMEILPGSNQTSVIPQGGQIPAVERKDMMDYIVGLRLDTMFSRAETLLINLDELTNQLQDQTIQRAESFLTNADDFTRQLQDPSGPLMNSLQNLHQITNEVNTGQGTVGQLVYNDQTIKALSQALAELKKATGQVSGLANELNRSLPPILHRTDLITTQVEQATRQVPEAMEEARRGLRGANEVLESVKRNFFIRGNLPQQPDPVTQTYPARQQARP